MAVAAYSMLRGKKHEGCPPLAQASSEEGKTAHALYGPFILLPYSVCNGDVIF